MSWQPAPDPNPAAAPPSQAEIVIVPRIADLGDGFTVRRVLPFAKRRMVGPFVFFDHFGPTVFRTGQGLDVRPHPHIGLATVTYLFDGEILHRDSLGTVQPIRPGAVNWMTAGRGIVHSERTPPALRTGGSAITGVQLWVALPLRHEEAAPAFAHHPAEALPRIEGDGRACASSPAPCSARARRSRRSPICSMPTRRSRKARAWRSRPSTRSAPSMSCPER